jgi:uncharacterized protein
MRSRDGSGGSAWLRWLRRVAISLLAIAACLALGLFEAGEILSNPATHEVGVAPADLGAHALAIASVGGRTVSGWEIRGEPGCGAVLLLHGIRADRRDMVERARWLKRNGFSVLLIDLPAHGETAGEHITFGVEESVAVRAALAQMRAEFAGERIGVIGESLGAASLVLAQPEPAPDAVVLESMFPSIEDAVEDRLELHLGRWARSMSPLLLWQLPLRLGVRADQIRPIESLALLHAPVLVAGGSRDRHTRREETERIFAAANPPKELWIVEGARHQDLYAYDRAAYEAKMLPFLQRYLGAAGGAN